MLVQVDKDIIEALSRELNQIRYSTQITRSTKIFTEDFDISNGKSIDNEPIGVDTYPDSHNKHEKYPHIEIVNNSGNPDKETKRMVPPYGTEVKVPAEGSQYYTSYKIIIKGNELLTTDGGGGDTVQLTHRKIRTIAAGDYYLRILSGNNVGTYQIDSVSLNGNGPHTITLSDTLLDELPEFVYFPETGVILFSEHVDLYTIEAGDYFYDSEGNSFEILNINNYEPAIKIATNQAVFSGENGYIKRTGDILKEDDEGNTVYYMILDPDEPQTTTICGETYTVRNAFVLQNWDTPYLYNYQVIIKNKEYDDYMAMLSQIKRLYSPPMGAVPVLLRTEKSAESKITKDFAIGRQAIKVEDVTGFIPRDTVYIIDDRHIGETLTIEKINYSSNIIKFTEPIVSSYKTKYNTKIVSNAERYWWNRFLVDLTNADSAHDKAMWLTLCNITIWGYEDSRITPYTEWKYSKEEEGVIQFINVESENLDEEDYITIEV